MLDLFSGIGGFSLAASWTGGIETVAFCEIEPFCQKVLKKHWPDIPIYSDIKELRGEDIVREHGAVDIVCGGFPCQPFSVAGKRRGKEDDRHLWPEMFRIIQETKPTWVVGENVVGLIDLALEDCFLDLESEGYEVQSFIIPACGVGAPHRRNRVWILAHSSIERKRGLPIQSRKSRQKGINVNGRSQDVADSPSERLSNGRRAQMGDPKKEIKEPERCNSPFYGLQTISYPKSIGLQRKWPEREQVTNLYGEQGLSLRGCGYRIQWAVEPDVGRVAHGIPDRIHRLKALGNSIVPKVVYPILQGIVDIEEAVT